MCMNLRLIIVDYHETIIINVHANWSYRRCVIVHVNNAGVVPSANIDLFQLCIIIIVIV